MDEIRVILEKSQKIALENPTKSYKLAVQALEQAEKQGRALESGQAYFRMAYACRVMSEYTEGLENAFRALNIFESFQQHEGILQARNIIGIIYFYYSDYKTALENFMIALDYLNSVENPKLESSILNNVGEIYRMAGDYEKALEYYSKSLELALTHQLFINISIINDNIGEIYYLQKDYKTACDYFNAAFESSLEVNDRITKGEAHTKLGKIKYIQGNYELAKEHYIAALELFNQVNNKFYLVEALIAFSELDSHEGGNPKPHLLEALNYAIENKLALKISIIYKRLVDYYESSHEYRSALKYHKLYHQNEKEIEAGNLSRKLELLALEFSFYKEKNENEKNKLLSEKLMREIADSKAELEEIKAKNRTLIEVSIMDELTQTYNRRGLNQFLEEAISKSNGDYDVLLMIDIDHFKTYNDYWGHLEGDRCLQHIASKLKAQDYKNYFVGRYGGEEFVCYMKVADVNEAEEIAEKIRKDILDLGIRYTKNPYSEIVSVSIGGVVDKMTPNAISDYINAADKWLYVSKEKGRNRVSIGQGL